ncbi:MAG: hypothetical protein LBC87_07220 [Fibromonadaceae bacterium]|jgi:hypothetical protein|nr:hypothetical protein [Fibromonadaceae bacterium]
MLDIKIPKRKKSKNEMKQLKNDLRFMGQNFMLLIEVPFRIFESCVNMTAEAIKNYPQNPKN